MPIGSAVFDLAAELISEVTRGRRVAVVTVTHVLGSAPRTVGTSMAVTEDGRVLGSISGGCVEAEAYALAEELLSTGLPAAAHFGFDDEAAFAAGLSCGGQLRVFGTLLRTSDESILKELQAASEGRPAGLAIVVSENERHRGLTVAASSESRRTPIGRAISEELHDRVDTGQNETTVLDVDGESVEVLFLTKASPARFIIFGAVDFSAALCDAAKLLDYRVTICDARPIFSTVDRFPTADDVVVMWPHRYLSETQVDGRTVIAVLTHDHKFDVPVLQLALSLGVAYVGAMGSRRTHDERLQQLVAAGVPAENLDRLHSPIGLDLGAVTPAETAVSIISEVLAAQRGATGRSLRSLQGPLHHRRGGLGIEGVSVRRHEKTDA
ncbi:MAG: XshC-Cox1-family protein [Frondihabitans sp.]|nr:XshC-Cox1-family protein [Frondihabitans sp.]